MFQPLNMATRDQSRKAGWLLPLFLGFFACTIGLQGCALSEVERNSKKQPGINALSEPPDQPREAEDGEGSLDSEEDADGTDEERGPPTHHGVPAQSFLQATESNTITPGEGEPRGSFSQLQVEDAKQQSELEDAYAKMLYLNDPDDVDKAEQVAWMKMQLEDKGFLNGRARLQNRPHKKQTARGLFLQNRRRMLNKRRASGSLSSWDPAAPAPSSRPAQHLAGAKSTAMLQVSKSAPASEDSSSALGLDSLSAASKELPQAYKDAELADM